MTCEAIQQSDQMVCKKCTMAWDINDPKPPKCNGDKNIFDACKAIEKPWLVIEAKHHYHKDEQGILHDCWHNCKSLFLDWKFWCGMTLGFPLEHALWDYVPPFCYLTKWLGL